MSLADTVSRIDRLSDEQRECIENCNEATEVCEWCADECLGDADMEECARLCRDVADLASLHARFLARDSQFSSTLAEACADACEACAEECSQHDADHCQVCADVLQECAESCRKLAGA
ncbi:four-helix bundle copper-binding protein [Halosimplex halobium]|uniref:four-helix bundle copper-binding protein n=1 Tax=Halosimplex halobium TaxID=3396618 RepID=UPI003F57B6A6